MYPKLCPITDDFKYARIVVRLARGSVLTKGLVGFITLSYENASTGFL